MPIVSRVIAANRTTQKLWQLDPDTGTWSLFSPQPPWVFGTFGPHAIFGLPSGDIWWHNGQRFCRFDPATQLWVLELALIAGGMQIHGLAADDVWFVQGNSVWHWNGTAVTYQGTVGVSMNAYFLWERIAGEPWVFSWVPYYDPQDRKLRRLYGGSWVDMWPQCASDLGLGADSIHTYPYGGVWGDAAGNLYFAAAKVGGPYRIVKYNGSVFSNVCTNLDIAAHAIVGLEGASTLVAKTGYAVADSSKMWTVPVAGGSATARQTLGQMGSVSGLNNYFAARHLHGAIDHVAIYGDGYYISGVPYYPPYCWQSLDGGLTYTLTTWPEPDPTTGAYHVALGLQYYYVAAVDIPTCTYGGGQQGRSEPPYGRCLVPREFVGSSSVRIKQLFVVAKDAIKLIFTSDIVTSRGYGTASGIIIVDLDGIENPVVKSVYPIDTKTATYVILEVIGLRETGRYQLTISNGKLYDIYGLSINGATVKWRMHRTKIDSVFLGIGNRIDTKVGSHSRGVLEAIMISDEKVGGDY